MEQKMKHALREYYEAPEPKGKQSFLRRYASRRISLVHMFLTQFRYISNWCWGLSLLLFAVAFVLSGQFLVPASVECIYGMVPFLVMITVTESFKSCRYGMQELEQGALFSLQSVVLMRMFILGTGNLFAMVILSLMTGVNPLAQLMYLLVPYLLTAALGLEVVRTVRGQEGSWLCFGVSAFVACVQIVVRMRLAFFYEERYLFLWVLTAFFALILAARESVGLIRRPEFM